MKLRAFLKSKVRQHSSSTKDLTNIDDIYVKQIITPATV